MQWSTCSLTRVVEMRNVKMVKGGSALRTAIGGGLAVVGANAMAAGTDFSTITAGLDGSTIATACVAAAVILALVGFAKWGSKKLGRFFG